MSTPDRPSFRSERERTYRRALAAGVLLSVLLHILLLWSTRAVRIRPSPFALPPVETVPAPAGLVAVDVAPAAPEEELEDPRPEPEEPPPSPEGPPEEEREAEPEEEPGETAEAPGRVTVERPADPSEEEGPPSMSNAQRLIPRFVDARIWFDPRDPLLFGERLAKFARADSAVRAILRDWLDSLRLSEEQRRRALDWTFEQDGKRWGISPEGLHLGDITIPIPFGFAPTGPQRRAFEQAIRDLREIQRQDLRSDLEEVEEERRRAMRERSEEEARRRSGDTTRVRPPPRFEPGGPVGGRPP